MLNLSMRLGEASGAALAMYMEDAKAEGGTLTECPECKSSFEEPPPPPIPEYECPNCNKTVSRSQWRCHGCNAELCFDMDAAEGAVVEETVTTEETVVEEEYYGGGCVDVWGPGYYYDPFVPDPFDMMAAAVLFDVYYDPYPWYY